MRLIRDIRHLPLASKGAALAIGNFDGLHLGHRAVLETVTTVAQAQGVPSAVMTFEPHPRMFFTPEHPPYRIEPLHRKLRRLRLSGIEIVYIQRFDRRLASMSADDFVSGILMDKLNVAHVVTGEGFVFGHRRTGTGATLRAAGFGYTATPERRIGGEVCSSSSIRAHLGAARMEQAAALLGRPYEITGRVQHGQARGRALGAPTANLGLHELFLPRYGVYAVHYRVSEGSMEDEGCDWNDGVANLGIRPSFAGTEPSLEVHGFEETRDLYGRRLCVRLLRFLREERRFDAPEALKAQIVQDIAEAKEALSQC